MLSVLLKAISLHVDDRPLTEAEMAEVVRRAGILGLADNDVLLHRVITEVRLELLLRQVSAKQDQTLVALELLARREPFWALLRRRWWRLGLGLAALGLAFLLGQQSLRRELYAERKQVEWVATPGGQSAQKLFEAGLAEALANCSFPEWRTFEGRCYPGVTPQGHWRGYSLPQHHLATGR